MALALAKFVGLNDVWMVQQGTDPGLVDEHALKVREAEHSRNIRLMTNVRFTPAAPADRPENLGYPAHPDPLDQDVTTVPFVSRWIC